MNTPTPGNQSKKHLEILSGQEPLITRSELNAEIAKKEEEVADVERKLREGHNGVALTDDEKGQLEQKLASRMQDLEGLKMIKPQEDKVINLGDIPHTVDSEGNMEFDEDSLTPEQLDIVFQALKENNYEESGGVVGTKEEVLTDNQSQITSEPPKSTENKVNESVDPLYSPTKKDPESVNPTGVDMSYVEMATGVPYDSLSDSGHSLEKNVENAQAAVETSAEAARKLKELNDFKDIAEKYTANDDDILRPFEQSGTPQVSHVEKRKGIKNEETLSKWVKNEHIGKVIAEDERRRQKSRSSIFWRIKNLGFKNVMTDFKIKSRNFFSKLFSFGKNDVVANGVTNVRTQETIIPEEYITQPGDNLSDIIKNQILSVPELANLTQKQKDAVVQNLFSYAKLNGNMSMFDQVNKFSDKGVIDSGSNIDLHMLKRLISFPVDHFKNKTIIEYSKEVTQE